MKYILFALLAWFLYQLVFKLIVPVYKTTRQIKKGFRQMQEKMNEQYQQQQPHSQPTNTASGGTKTPAGDYIDFEEVKP
jgi:fatty acid desaturase